MPTVAIILILISAISHTIWHSISKNVNATCKTLFWANLLSIIIFIPLMFFAKDYLYIYKSFLIPGLITGFTNALAYWGLLAAYRHGELTLVYPLNNALPIVLSTIFALIIGEGNTITPLAYMGFILIVLGCVFLPIENFKVIDSKTFFNKSVLFVTICAIGTAVYSNVDSSIMHSIREIAPNVENYKIGILYIPYIALTTSLFLLPFMLIDYKFYNVNYKEEKFNFPFLFTMGAFVNVGYFLVVIAYGLAKNVNYIIAFRQIGLLFTMLVGFILFKEKLYTNKIIGATLILIGLIIIVIK